MWESGKDLIDCTKEAMKREGVSLRKNWGQNFLIDIGIANKIVKAAEISKKDTLLEIGGGAGVLSIPMSSLAGKLIIVERDKRMIEHLHKKLGQKSNVEFISEDILKVKHFPNFTKCVSNIPYNISSPILSILLRLKIEGVTLMLQKEFAARLNALPGTKNYSRLSLRTSFLDIKKICEVSSKCFIPQPKVDSIVVSWKNNKKDPWNDIPYADEFSRILFSTKKKKIQSVVSQRIKKGRRKKDIRKVERLSESVGELRPFSIGMKKFEYVCKELVSYLEEMDKEWYQWFFWAK